MLLRGVSFRPINDLIRILFYNFYRSVRSFTINDIQGESIGLINNEKNVLVYYRNSIIRKIKGRIDIYHIFTFSPQK